MATDLLLTNLNTSQHAAVTSTADTLAILAGPGSGKTHTLTSRTTWLLAQGLQPWNVIVATFTVKAAREMKERIGKLIGNGTEGKLILGTFHSISRRYLARYGHLIGLKSDFGIADTADSAAIIKRIIKRHDYVIDPKAARSRISASKARGAGYKDSTTKSKKTVETEEFEELYLEYEKALERSNLLDYDDLLLRCVDLLRAHPSCVSNVEAVLIDEFQDTNLIQFDLMRLFAAARKRITIVGDPDQSIYSFRAAEIKNYKRMLRQYPDTVTISLEENYRSSGAILLSALTVIQQDNARIKKSLLATHCVGTPPVLRKLSSAHQEAEWIVMEIQRCLGMSGGLLDLNDFAILVRSASLSRLIESALGKSGIAYRMVGGPRFYDRLEVKLLLDYLRIVSQPNNNDALARIINVPSRRIGEGTIKGLLEEADTSNTTLWNLVLDVVQGRRQVKTQIKKAQEQGLRDFVGIIFGGQKKLSGSKSDSCNILGLITHLLDKLEMENWLKKHHNDETGARWDNIQELVTQVNDFQDLLSIGYDEEALPEIDDVVQSKDTGDHLARFLANVALASDVKNADETAKPQVTISTIHAAKGLEWPIVFIPAAFEGSIPHSRSEDTDEERRLLYVAMTRAQALLYLSCPLKTSSGDGTTLSPFLQGDVAKLLRERGPSITLSMVQNMSQILRRPCPTLQSIARMSTTLQNTEDDAFVTNGDSKQDMDLRWSLTRGGRGFETDDRSLKRRKIGIERSTSDLMNSSSRTVETTMTRLSNSLSSSHKPPGFVSASHLSALNERSMNSPVCGSESRKQGPQAREKTTGGQSTLLNFLGKSEPQDQLPAEPLPPASASSRLYGCLEAKDIRSERVIDVEVTSHRVAAAPLKKPRTQPFVSRENHDSYVFLSSSPPRNRVEEPVQLESESNQNEVKRVPGSVETRPPSHHVTSQDIMKAQLPGSRKVLGVRRTIGTGWESNKGTKFKPPTMQQSKSFSALGNR